MNHKSEELFPKLWKSVDHYSVFNSANVWTEFNAIKLKKIEYDRSEEIGTGQPNHHFGRHHFKGVEKQHEKQNDNDDDRG